MDRQDTRLVSRHDWFQVFLERDSSRRLLVRRGGGGDDWRWYAGAAHSSSAAPLRRAPACCILCSSALVLTERSSYPDLEAEARGRRQTEEEVGFLAADRRSEEQRTSRCTECGSAASVS